MYFSEVVYAGRGLYALRFRHTGVEAMYCGGGGGGGGGWGSLVVEDLSGAVEAE